MSLYDDGGDPGYHGCGGPTPRRERVANGITLPEQLEGIADLKGAIETKDTNVLARTMALALYRLGAEPLNKLARDMLAGLEGQL